MDKVFSYLLNFAVVYCIYCGLSITVLSLFLRVNEDVFHFCSKYSMIGATLVTIVGIIVDLRSEEYEDENIIDNF
jgi:hypothetical protein